MRRCARLLLQPPPPPTRVPPPPEAATPPRAGGRRGARAAAPAGPPIRASPGPTARSRRRRATSSPPPRACACCASRAATAAARGSCTGWRTEREGHRRVYVAAAQIRAELGMWPDGVKQRDQFNRILSSRKAEARGLQSAEQRLRPAVWEEPGGGCRFLAAPSALHIPHLLFSAPRRPPSSPRAAQVQP